MTTAIVYSETVVHVAPDRYAADAPYQLAIAILPDGTKRTVRIVSGHRVSIGDAIVFVQSKEGVDYWALAARSKLETVSNV